MRRALSLVGYALGGLAVAIGLTVGTSAVAGRTESPRVAIVHSGIIATRSPEPSQTKSPQPGRSRSPKPLASPTHDDHAGSSPSPSRSVLGSADDYAHGDD